MALNVGSRPTLPVLGTAKKPGRDLAASAELNQIPSGFFIAQSLGSPWTASFLSCAADIVGGQHAGAPTMPGAAVAGVATVRSTLPHYRRRRRRFSFSFAQACAAGNAHRDESCNQSEQYFFHWRSPFFTPSDALCASPHRWSRRSHERFTASGDSRAASSAALRTCFAPRQEHLLHLNSQKA